MKNIGPIFEFLSKKEVLKCCKYA